MKQDETRMKQHGTIKYKDLAWYLKVAVVVAWFDLVIYGFSFMVGFFEGLLG